MIAAPSTVEESRPGEQPQPPPRAHDRTFDGVICFGGEDWWYHNRGHYDMQMMRELSAHVPVLYVNSIGMRRPRLTEGSMFFRRVARKLKSLRRGLVRVRPGFAVFSPFVAPGPLGMALTGPTLPWQVRRAARKVGVARPLVWVACPPAADAALALDPVALVYQRTDRYERFKDVDPQRIRACDQRLKARADLTFFCSTLVFEQERDQCRGAVYVDHGVDYDAFSAAAEHDDEPGDVRDIARPRAGFIGGLDSHTFDPELFISVASRMTDVQFILVGACSLPEDWCDLENVHLLGQRAYERVPAYMAACDALIMPWTRSEWIEACNPVKLKEYLAVGRPVVTTPFHELVRYEGLVRVASSAAEFAEALRAAITECVDPEPGRARVRAQTWRAKGRHALEALARLGVAPADRSHEEAA